MTALAGEGRKMAGYDRDFLRLLTDKLNIVEVASSYLHLEKKGGTYWACCPFHHEKTASFHVDENRQFYHCFGCGASGNVIKLVQELENVDFGDAVKLLAERANLPLPQSGFDGERTAELKRKRDTLLKIMNDSAHFYLDNLNSGKADAHIEYILKRGIPANIVRSFGLGASLNSQDLPKFLLAKGYSRQDIVDSGAVNEVEGRLSDSQSGRLIFPIINAFDEVIAFGGRAIRPTDFAKYKNTKETLIFNKSKTLYNINKLKKLRRAGGLKDVIMVEGYMDALSLYQAGFRNVVASMGTSLTQEQARMIKRYCTTVLISYDGDGAGQKANMRGLEILKSEGVEVRVVPLPDGLDPDEVIKQRGPEAYRACLDAAMPLVDYKLEVSRRAHDLTKPEEKLKYVGEALKVVRTAETAAEREMMLKNLRDETGISFEALSRDLQQIPAAPQEKGGDVPEEARRHRRRRVEGLAFRGCGISFRRALYAGRGHRRRAVRKRRPFAHSGIRQKQGDARRKDNAQRNIRLLRQGHARIRRTVPRARPRRRRKSGERSFAQVLFRLPPQTEGRKHCASYRGSKKAVQCSRRCRKPQPGNGAVAATF